MTITPAQFAHYPMIEQYSRSKFGILSAYHVNREFVVNFAYSTDATHTSRIEKKGQSFSETIAAIEQDLADLEL